MFKGKSEQKWVYGDLIHRKEKTFILTENDELVEVLPNTICCHIKDGFWLNDIIKYVRDEEFYGVICFGLHEQNYGFYVKWYGEIARHFRQDLPFWLEKAESVGNIFDDKSKINISSL